MPTLRIYRVPYLYGGFRKAEVWVDDVLLGKLKNGASQSFEISSGQHRIFIKMPIKAAESIIEVPEVGTLNLALNYVLLSPRPTANAKVIWLKLIPYIWLTALLKLCGVPVWLTFIGYSIWGILNLIKMRKKKASMNGGGGLQLFYYFSPDDPATIVRSKITTIFFRNWLLIPYCIFFAIWDFIFGVLMSMKPIAMNGFGYEVTLGVITTVICLIGYTFQAMMFSEKFCQECEKHFPKTA